MLTDKEKGLLFLAFSKGFDDGHVSYMLGYNKQRVTYWRVRFGFQSEDVKNIRWGEWARLARAGIDLRFIGFLYRVKENTVRMRLHLLGVSLREIKVFAKSKDNYSKLFWYEDYENTWYEFLETN